MRDISDLQIQLQRTKLQNKDQPLFQLLKDLINGLKDTSDDLNSLASGGGPPSDVVTNNYHVASASGINSGSTGLSASSISSHSTTGNGIINRLAKFAATGLVESNVTESGGTLTIADLVSVTTLGSHLISASGVGNNTLTVRNTSAGTINYALIAAATDVSATQAYLQAFSSTFTTVGSSLASGASLVSEGLGGLSIVGVHASGAIRFYTVVTERGRIHPSGGFSWGDTTDPGALNFRAAGNLTVLGGADVSGNFTVSSTLSVAPGSGSTSVNGSLAVAGNFTIGSGPTKFSVTASSGNTNIQGVLTLIGDFTINTNKFTVAASTGNTLVAGTLNVTGATTLSSTLGVTGLSTLTGGIAIGGSAFTSTAISLDTGSTYRNPLIYRFSSSNPHFVFGVEQSSGFVWQGMNALQNSGADTQQYAVSSQLAARIRWNATADPAYLLQTAASGTAGNTITWTDGISVKTDGTFTAEQYQILTVSSKTLTYDGATNNNNVDPGGKSVVRFTAASGSSSALLTGMSGGVAGRRIYILNIGPGQIEIKFGDANSSAGNRFEGPSSLPSSTFIPAGFGGTFYYDGTSTSWRLV